MNRVFRAFRLSVSAIALLAGMVSCAKDTEVVDPYADWEGKNVEFIDSIFNVASNPPEGEIWRMYFDYAISFDNEFGEVLDPYEKKQKDFVYVKYKNADDVLNEEGLKEYPIVYGDTVVVAYQGFLINGERFDGTYYGTFDKDVTDNFAKFAVIDKRNNPKGGLIGGWVNALIHMKPKTSNEMEVYIPAELAYGTTGSGSSIPGNSVLKFEMYVDDVIKPKLQK